MGKGSGKRAAAKSRRDDAGEQRGLGRRVGRRAFVGMAAGGGATLAELAVAVAPASAGTTVSTRYVSTIGTVAQPGQLRQLTSSIAGERVDAGGFWAIGDGGGSEFYWDTSSHTGDNGGTIIVPAGSTTGRWVRLTSLFVEADAGWWGVKANGSADDTAALQQAITTTAGLCVLRLPNGISNVSEIIVIPAYAHIVGPGATYAGGGDLVGAWWQWKGSGTGTVCMIGTTTQTTPVVGILLEDFGISGATGGNSSGITAMSIVSAPGGNGATGNIRGRGLSFAEVNDVLSIGSGGNQADFLRFEHCQAFEHTGVGILIDSDNAADESLFSEWFFYGASGSTGVQIGSNGCGFVEFDNINVGGRVSSTDYMFNIDQTNAASITIRNCEQEGCAFMYVNGASDAVAISLHANTVNPAGSSTLPTIVIDGINRVVGMGNEIRGGIALSNPGAKYIGVMDRFAGVPTGTTLLSQVNSSVLVNFETMHSGSYDIANAVESFGSPAGQITFQPGSTHPELTGIVGDLCTRTGGRCQTWASGINPDVGDLFVPTIDNGYQYYNTVSGGKTGSTEPTWPTTFGATVTDGTCTWTNAGQSGVFEGFGPLDHYKQAAAPTSGYHRQSAVVWSTAPQPGGYIGWVCTATGNPGTWKGFGAISK